MIRLLTIIFLVICVRLDAQQPKMSKSLEFRTFLGNWYREGSNIWRYGFYEEFAVVDGKTYTYTSVRKVKKGVEVRLASMSDRSECTLKLQMRNGGLSINDQSYAKVEKFLPNYLDSDHKAYYDSDFKSVDTVTISGYLRNNNNAKRPYSVEVQNWITGESENYYGDIDANGLFVVKVPLYNSSQVFLDHGRSFMIDVLIPGEEYFIYHDLATKETLFYGEHARLHNELTRYGDYIKNYRPETKIGATWQTKDNYERSLKDMDFLNLKMSQLDSLKQINDVFVQRSNLSDRSAYFIEKNSEFSIAADLMKKEDQLDRKNGELFSEQYIGQVKSLFFDNNVKPLSLIRDNQTFLKAYLRYVAGLPIYGGNVLYHDEILNTFIHTGKISASADLKRYSELNLKKLLHTSLPQDSVALAELIKQQPNIPWEYYGLQQQYQELISLTASQEFTVFRPFAAYEKFAPHTIRELFHAQNVFFYFKTKPAVLDDTILTSFLSPISNRILQNAIILEHDHIRGIAQGSLMYADHLKDTDHLVGAKDADKILREILAPHKGKVVYVDFWGTWCGPCIEEMKYVPKVKEEMEGRDVVFIYFANSTPQKAWENFIKSSNLEGSNVFHYNLPTDQQQMIEMRFGVKAFPTYLLINKNGNLVTNKAPRPSNYKALIEEIDKLLK